MTPNQVQFCFAVAQGNASLAKELLPGTVILPSFESYNEILKSSNFNYFPAIYCLWAARQLDPRIPISKLKELFPREVSLGSEIHEPPAQGAVYQIVQELIFPLVRQHLLSFLNNFTSLAGSGEINNFYVSSSIEGLKLILADPFFRGMGIHRLQLIEKIRDKLTQFEELSNFYIGPKDPVVMPRTISRLREILNGEVTAEEEGLDLSPSRRTYSRSYLPGLSYARTRTAVVGTNEPQLRQESYRLNTPKAVYQRPEAAFEGELNAQMQNLGVKRPKGRIH